MTTRMSTPRKGEYPHPRFAEHNLRAAVEAEKRRIEVVRLLRAGYIQADIARMLGMPRRSIWRIVQRAREEDMLPYE